MTHSDCNREIAGPIHGPAGIYCTVGIPHALWQFRQEPCVLLVVRPKLEYGPFPHLLIGVQDFPGLLVIATSLQWPITISFAISLRLGILGMDMPFGSRPQGIFIPSWGLATLVTFAKADSTVSSIFFFLPVIHPMKTLVFQITTNRSSPKCQDISYLVYFVPITFFRPELPWSPMKQITKPQGCRDAQSRSCHSSSFSPREPGEVSFSCKGKQGAVLSLPIQAKRENTVVRKDFGK